LVHIWGVEGRKQLHDVFGASKTSVGMRTGYSELLRQAHTS